MCRKNKLCVCYLYFPTFIWGNLLVKLNRYHIFCTALQKLKMVSVKVVNLVHPHWNLLSVIQVLWLSRAHSYHCQYIFQICSDLPLKMWFAVTMLYNLMHCFLITNRQYQCKKEFFISSCMCPESWNCLIGTKYKYFPLVYFSPCLCYSFLTGMWYLFQCTELNFYGCGIFMAFICCLFILWKTVDFSSQMLVFGNPQL